MRLGVGRGGMWVLCISWMAPELLRDGFSLKAEWERRLQDALFLDDCRRHSLTSDLICENSFVTYLPAKGLL